MGQWVGGWVDGAGAALDASRRPGKAEGKREGGGTVCHLTEGTRAGRRAVEWCLLVQVGGWGSGAGGWAGAC